MHKTTTFSCIHHFDKYKSNHVNPPSAKVTLIEKNAIVIEGKKCTDTGCGRNSSHITVSHQRQWRLHLGRYFCLILYKVLKFYMRNGPKNGWRGNLKRKIFHNTIKIWQHIVDGNHFFWDEILTCINIYVAQILELL